jgi:hypothetical protein
MEVTEALVPDQELREAPGSSRYSAYSKGVYCGVVVRADLYAYGYLVTLALAYPMVVWLGASYATAISSGSAYEIVSTTMLQFLVVVWTAWFVDALLTRPLFRSVGTSDSAEVERLRRAWYLKENASANDIVDRYDLACRLSALSDRVRKIEERLAPLQLPTPSAPHC